jgi:hypothetical protein
LTYSSAFFFNACAYFASKSILALEDFVATCRICTLIVLLPQMRPLSPLHSILHTFAEVQNGAYTLAHISMQAHPEQGYGGHEVSYTKNYGWVFRFSQEPKSAGDHTYFKQRILVSSWMNGNGKRLRNSQANSKESGMAKALMSE